MQTLALIIPAYNEEKRLPRTFDLLEQAKNEGVFSSVELIEILLIDDGSKDRTAAMIEDYQKSHPQYRVIRVVPNQGKGNAIHTGLKAAQADWCLIADADTATPWDQFKKVWAAGTPVSIGSRDLPESKITTSQSWVREHMGRTFNFLVRMITGLPFRDTQCGFKLINRQAIQPFIEKLEVKRFAWDVELLMFARAYQLGITEVPVSWEHQDASRVNPIKDSIEMLIRVIQMRLRICFLKK